jgi:hypothetical protein
VRVAGGAYDWAAGWAVTVMAVPPDVGGG